MLKKRPHEMINPMSEDYALKRQSYWVISTTSWGTLQNSDPESDDREGVHLFCENHKNLFHGMIQDGWVVEPAATPIKSTAVGSVQFSAIGLTCNLR